MVFASFATQPPELISGKIYAGPGAGSLLTAASAWDSLSAELQSAAASYQSAISGLVSSSWTGPSSESFAAAAAPYVSWLSTTASQAEETANQARAAAAAYETAFASVVSPAVIAENRSLLATLVSTNILGQNNSAIAQLEAEYSQIWAQDVAAITNYFSNIASATQLSQFTEAPTTTNAAAGIAQAAATAAPAAADPITTLATNLTQIEASIQSFANSYATAFTDGLQSIFGGTQPTSLYSSIYSFASSVGSQATYTNVVNSTTSLGISQWKNFFVYKPWSAGIPLGSLNGGLGGGAGLTSAAAPVKAASAALGSAQTVGSLSVPPSWAGATPAIRLASAALPSASAAAAPAAGFPNLLNPAALGSLTGGALGSPASRAVQATNSRSRITGGARREAPVKLDKVIAKLQAQPDDVQHWNVDEAGLDDLVARLSTKPGIHAVHINSEAEPAAARPDSLLG